MVDCAHSDRMECAACNGAGFRWRVPDSFNPFSAGGWNTIKAMYRVPCRDCSGNRERDPKVETKPVINPPNPSSSEVPNG